MCPNALSEVGLEEVNMEAGPEPLSVNVPMLETDVGATESRVDFTAEPAAANKEGRKNSRFFFSVKYLN